MELKLLSFIFFLFYPSQVFAAVPVVFYTDITSGPNTGGENNAGCYLTINGGNFGEEKGTSTVTIGEGAVYSYISWSDNEISVQLGSSVVTGNITVTTPEGTSHAPEAFTVRSGELYFMSLAGVDGGGCGSISSPCRTANYVLDLSSFGAGDFMVIRGGTYDLSSGNENLQTDRWINFDNDKSGTLTNPITIYGYPGEIVNVSWGTYTSDGPRGIQTVGVYEYLNFANITFDLEESTGIAIYLGYYGNPGNYCNHARLVNLTVTDGMVGSTYGLNVLSLQRVDDLKMYGLDVGNQSPNADPALESHMIYLSHAYNNADLGWLYVHDNAYGRGALQIAGDGAEDEANLNVRVHDSIFENLPQEAILCGPGSEQIYIYNNIINNVCTRGTSGFSPIALRGSDVDEGDYYLYNNTIYTDATSGGIIQFEDGWTNYTHSATLYNNIIYAKSSSTSYYQLTGGNVTTDIITADNNIWYGSSAPMPTFEGANGKNVDPLFVDKVTGNFHLQASSPAIGAGTVIVLSTPDPEGTPRGVVFDIGAFEYQDGSIVYGGGSFSGSFSIH